MNGAFVFPPSPSGPYVGDVSKIAPPTVAEGISARRSAAVARAKAQLLADGPRNFPPHPQGPFVGWADGGARADVEPLLAVCGDHGNATEVVGCEEEVETGQAMVMEAAGYAQLIASETASQLREAHTGPMWDMRRHDAAAPLPRRELERAQLDPSDQPAR